MFSTQIQVVEPSPPHPLSDPHHPTLSALFAFLALLALLALADSRSAGLSEGR